jgi:membrane-bound ClpP family serine protease
MRAPAAVLGLGLVALVATPGPVHAEPPSTDLRVARLEGILDARTVAALERTAREASRRGDGLLLVVDSPGGDLEVAQKAMLTVLFAGVPVVAWIPDHGQASGAALLPLMGAGLITMAPTARLGTRHGLGRFAATALGPFGERLFAAASEARSGSVDWMVVTLSDGGQIGARGAKRRGVAAVVAPDMDRALRALRGREVTVPLTGEVAVLSGRRIDAGTPLSALVGRPWRSPAALAALLCTALAMLGLTYRRPSWGPLTVVALVALGVVLRGAEAVPIWRPAVLLCGAGALLCGVSAGRRRGAFLVALAAPCLALGARMFVDLGAPGLYLDDTAAVPGAAAGFVAVVLAVLTLSIRRLAPGPESFLPASGESGVDSTGPRP